MNILDEIRNDLAEIKAALSNSQALQPAVEERLITRDEACKLFVPVISRQTLSNYTKNVPLKVYKLAGRLYYKQSEIIGAVKELKAYKKTEP